ncbi:DUF2388 domain-containing protein [Bdellovibrio sp. SKB1291214]|uniref:DUF2388 domain-containing protein n=1 Tax=Bdellovibrio sp. SKB1291214 TaxID=1732569 RepID=UPI000B51C65F|nr:DUF2388 domain-containing protein [Bdellovibrio sp. SKB1291214]UYL10092.1 DUF2388 domain-containing protein [Bdellovibrio sp. SKB1291214]
MKAVLFVLVSALSMNAMALEITTTVKLSQKNSAESDYKQILMNAQDDAAMFVATGGQVRGPNLETALENVRFVNRTTATDMQIAEEILKLK